MRLQSLTTFVAILLFQSTHPRGVRLNIKLFGIPTRWISIHAPARGATVILPGIFAPACLFQSTHPRGVRQKQLPPLKVCHKNFNPRTREGCDIFNISMVANINDISIHTPARGATPPVSSVVSLLLVISIHAPAKGATLAIKRTTTFWNNFNPRTREGCDGAEQNVYTSEIIFQSTHPRRVRPCLTSQSPQD